MNRGTGESRERARQMLQGLVDHLQQRGVGQIPEIFEGDAPHRPGGCFAQAWSVAEALRVLCEDIMQLSSANEAAAVAN